MINPKETLKTKSGFIVEISFGLLFSFNFLVDNKCVFHKWSEVKVTQWCWLFETPWTVACQVPLSMGLSRQEYWSRLPGPPPGDLPNPGIKPASFISPALTGGFFTTSTTWKAVCVNLSSYWEPLTSIRSISIQQQRVHSSFSFCLSATPFSSSEKSAPYCHL